MWTRRTSGSINQPNIAPLAMYSSILLRSCETRSVLERSSTTKSGQIGEKLSFSCLVKCSHFSRLTQDASGDRLAPFGNANIVDESKQMPLPSFLVQSTS